jgi:hypothetical protein
MHPKEEKVNPGHGPNCICVRCEDRRNAIQNPPPVPEDTPEVDEARVRRYADAAEDALADTYGTYLDGGTPAGAARCSARAVIAVADEEQTALRAELERLHAMEFIHNGCPGLREKDNAHLIARAEAAEAEVADARERLRQAEERLAAVEALAYDRDDEADNCYVHYRDIRAALAVKHV